MSLTASLHFPISQVEIHSLCILAMHQLFPCNDFHPSMHFALADSIACYIISFPNKSKQKGLWYLPRLEQGPYFCIFYILHGSHPSAALLPHPFSKSRFGLLSTWASSGLLCFAPPLLFKQNYLPSLFSSAFLTKNSK